MNQEKYYLTTQNTRSRKLGCYQRVLLTEDHREFLEQKDLNPDDFYALQYHVWVGVGCISSTRLIEPRHLKPVPQTDYPTVPDMRMGLLRDAPEVAYLLNRGQGA